MLIVNRGITTFERMQDSRARERFQGGRAIMPLAVALTELGKAVEGLLFSKAVVAVSKR